MQTERRQKGALVFIIYHKEAVTINCVSWFTTITERQRQNPKRPLAAVFSAYSKLYFPKWSLQWTFRTLFTLPQQESVSCPPLPFTSQGFLTASTKKIQYKWGHRISKAGSQKVIFFYLVLSLVLGHWPLTAATMPWSPNRPTQEMKRRRSETVSNSQASTIRNMSEWASSGF